MRKGMFWAGVGTLIAGVAIFAVSIFEITQASAQLMGCVGTNPYSGPIPPGCMSAVGTMFMFGTLEWVGIVGGVVGFVLLLLGVFLEPERPPFSGPVYYPSYVPPAYGPPPAAQPPQGPQTPPPQP